MLGGTVAKGQTDTLYRQKRDWRTGERERLPEWMAGPWEEGCIVAVSDPGLKPEIAREQALIRAAFWYAFSRGVKISVVTDYFNMNHTRYDYEFCHEKLISMIRIDTEIPAVKWRIREEKVTQYGEVLLKVCADTVDTYAGTIRFTGDLMFVNDNRRYERNEIRCELAFIPSRPGKLRVCNYSLKGEEEDLHIRTSLNDTVIHVPWEGYWYDALGESRGKTKGYKLNGSIWCAQVQSLLYALSGHAWIRVKMKNLEEDYRQTDERGLKREVVQAKVTVYATGMNVVSNCLAVDWRIKDW